MLDMALNTKEESIKFSSKLKLKGIEKVINRETKLIIDSHRCGVSFYGLRDLNIL